MGVKPIIIIIDNYYFDVTEYASKHPGGSKILEKYHLKDSTNEFNKIKGHGDSYVESLLDQFCIGSVKDIDIEEYLKNKYKGIIK